MYEQQICNNDRWKKKRRTKRDRCNKKWCNIKIDVRKTDRKYKIGEVKKLKIKLDVNTDIINETRIIINREVN